MKSACTALALLILPCALFAQEPYIGVFCTDYEVSGMISTLASEAPWTPSIDLASTCPDAVLAENDGLLYVVGRFGCDNVSVHDPDNGFALIGEYSVGAGSNPQGMAFSPDGAKAYVSRQEEDDVLVVEPLTGAVLGSIDLSAWADADGSAELGQLLRVGDYIFVAVGRLDRDFYWLPVGDSYLAVIDTQSDALLDVDPEQPGLQAILLTGTNPAWELHLDPEEKIVLSCVGSFGLQDGGVERVDPVALASEGFLIDEAALGGDVNDVAIASADAAYAIVSDAAFDTQLKRFDPASGGGVELVVAAAGYQYTDIEIDASGDLYLTDRSPGASGLRVYDAESGAPQAGPLYVGMPPYDILVPGDAGVAAEDAAPSPFARLSAWPNPFNPRSVLIWEGLPPGPAAIDIIDVAGRRVARETIADQPGRGQIVWSARTKTGAPLPSAVYFARIEAGGKRGACRLVLLR
jgi:hypothetical protein